MKVTRYMNLLELPVEFTGVAGDNCKTESKSDETVVFLEVDCEVGLGRSDLLEQDAII